MTGHWHRLVIWGLALVGMIGAGPRPLPGPNPAGYVQSGTTTGARWTGTITETEPEHKVLGLITSSLTKYELTLVEKISAGGSVSLQLESLSWRTERRWANAWEHGYITFETREYASGSLGQGECRGSGQIGYSEDEATALGIVGTYGLNIRVKGKGRKTGFETGAKHVSTGPMSHALIPTYKNIDEEVELGGGVTISGRLENGLTLMTGANDGTEWTISKSGSDVEVVLEPVDERAYADFIPSLGQSLSFKVRLVKPAGMIGYPYFVLADTSAMPGYCLNAEIGDDDMAWIRSRPGLSGYDQDGPDWVLDASESKYFIEGRQRGAQGKDAVSEDVMSVTALDAGAIGRLQAYMIIDGVPYQATYKRTGQPYAILPLDENPINLIADAAPQNSAWSPDIDEDDSPKGNKVIKGDGLTAYEEYRGFMAQGAHVRTDIDRKTIFVRNRYGHYWRAYLTLGLEAYDIEEDEYPPAGGLIKHGLINYYNGDYQSYRLHAQNQYAVLIHPSISPYFHGLTAYSDEVAPPSAESNDVKVNPLFLVRDDYNAVDPGISFAAYLQRLLDHELGHRIGISHHGELDEKNYRDAEGTRWSLVAVRGGQHSGWEGCAMRYDMAVGFLQDPARKKVIPYDPPPMGDDFCTSLVADPITGPPSVAKPCRQQFSVKSPQSR